MHDPNIKYRNIILQRINSVVLLSTRIVLLLESLLWWWTELRTMLRHLNRRGSKRNHLSAFNSVQFTIYYMFFFNIDAVVCENNDQFQGWELNIWQFIVIVEIKYFLNLNKYYLPIFILSIHFRQISPKTFRVIITIILCYPWITQYYCINSWYSQLSHDTIAIYLAVGPDGNTLKLKHILTKTKIL
jgi:hypothetical protein